MSQAPSQRSRQSYPLALLFLLCTFAAVMAAIVRPLLNFDSWEDMLGGLPNVVIAFFLSVICGALLGLIVGLYQFHRAAGVLCGMGIGAVLGPMAALLLTANVSAMQSLIPTVLIGSVVMLLVAWFTRPAPQIEEDEVQPAYSQQQPAYSQQQPAYSQQQPGTKAPPQNPFAD